MSHESSGRDYLIFFLSFAIVLIRQWDDRTLKFMVIVITVIFVNIVNSESVY